MDTTQSAQDGPSATAAPLFAQGRLLVAAAGVAMLLLDGGNRVVAANMHLFALVDPQRGPVIDAPVAGLFADVSADGSGPLFVSESPPRGGQTSAVIRGSEGRLQPVSLTVVPLSGRTNTYAGALLTIIPSAAVPSGAEPTAFEQQAALAAIVESCEDGILSTDADGIIRSWNAAAERLYGYSAEEIIGQPVSLLVPPGHEQDTAGLLADLHQGRHVPHFATRRMRKGGEIFDAVITYSAVRDRQGTYAGASAIVRDVSEQRRLETGLRRGRELMRIMLSQAPISVSAWDREGRYVFAEGSLLRSLGVQAGELTGRSAFDVWVDQPERAQLIRDALAGRTGHALLNLSGRMVDAHFSPVRDDDGTIIGALAVVLDAHEQAQTERELRAERERLQAVLGQAPIVLSVIDRDGVFTLVEGSTLATLNMQSADIVGLTVEDLRVRDPRLPDLFAQVLAGGSVRDKVVRDGRTFDRQITPMRAAGGQVNGAIIVSIDVTEQTLMEAALSERQRQLDQLLNSSLFGIVAVTPDGELVYANDGFRTLLGYTRDDVEYAGVQWSRMVPEQRREQITALTERVLRAGAQPVIETELQRKDGSLAPVLLSMSSYQDGEGRTVLSSLMVDLSERKRAEAAEQERQVAEQANRAKSEFLSRMSHELRTPLNSIIGFSQLMEMSPLTDQQQRNVGFILAAGRHLLHLINEVLDIARIEEGKLAMSPEPVNLRQAMRETADLARPLAAASGIDLRLDEADAGDLWAVADRQRLNQVLLNLVGNAIKYNHPGGSVALVARRGSEGQVCVAVRDTGPGIPAAKLGRLFTPFDRLGAEATLVEGTGLGLALSRRLVEAMSGTITVESREGAGSTFTVALQASRSPAHEAAGVNVEDIDQGGPGAPRTVLYVEDNLANLELTRELLSRWPAITLLSAMTGPEGLALARTYRPDLVLLDLHLPELSGEQVLAALKAAPETATIPVVVLSADATGGQVQRLLAAGATAYLTKPLDVRRFYQEVAAILNPVTEGRSR